MVILMDYPTSLGTDMKMPFPDSVKYGILAISLTLLLLALCILLWQTVRWCKQERTIQDTDFLTENSEILYSKASTSEHFSGCPNMTWEDVSAESHRLSRCLCESPVPTTASGQAVQTYLEKVHGSLHFSLYYNVVQSKLVVTVLKGEELQRRRDNHSLRPFVRIQLMWAERLEGVVNEEGKGSSCALHTVLQEWQTRIVKDSCNPVFGDQFSCRLEEEKLRQATLRMEVKDYDKFSRQVLIGQVKVPLGQLNISYPLELQKELQTPEKDVIGEVLLSLRFLPTSQRVEVGLLKTRTLLTDTCSHTGLYARVSIQCNQSKLRHQKTSIMPRCKVTVFNQLLSFILPEFPLEDCVIMIFVYETHTTRTACKNLIGQLTVRKGRRFEDEHWSLMMRSVRQPVARWHQLLI